MTKYKIRLKQKEGRWVDVLPAWTTFAIQNKDKMGGPFDAVYWNPPDRYAWFVLDIPFASFNEYLKATSASMSSQNTDDL